MPETNVRWFVYGECDDCDGTVQNVSIGLGCACRLNQYVKSGICTCGSKSEATS
ncbi:hypothetical protein [Streptomyces sp. NPDC002994]|uniref:hypothetical protein n=1 Tax=Streptomyces sp. NPDC002994 TaxID=3154441 RepID=UPI0033BABF9F